MDLHWYSCYDSGRELITQINGTTHRLVKLLSWLAAAKMRFFMLWIT